MRLLVSILTLCVIPFSLVAENFSKKKIVFGLGERIIEYQKLRTLICR